MCRCKSETRLCEILISAFCVGIMAFSIAQAQQWTSLDGPYWVDGIDVAYGIGGDNQAWHRYLAGGDGSEKTPFFWDVGDERWFLPNSPIPPPAANKLISYRTGDEGNIAFCSAFDDNIYITEDGGVAWDPICDFDDVTNTKFSAIEIFDYEGYRGSVVYVGSQAVDDEPSAFKGQLVSGNWEWSVIGTSGLAGKNVNDLEYPPTGNATHFAACDDGLYKIDIDDEDWEVIAFEDQEVPCIEFMDNHDEMWATTLVEGETHLHYSYANILPEFEEILFGGEPFNHDAKDMAVIPIIVDTDRQSVYIAGDDGLYLIDCSRDGQIYGYFDFQYDAGITAGSPFRYDRHVKAVDYYQINETPDKAYIIVGTENNVFLIEEVRSAEDAGVIALHVSDISKGAFISNVVAAALPLNAPSGTTVLSNSTNGIIKGFDGEEWCFSALAYDVRKMYPMIGTDISTQFSGTEDYILASSRDGNHGEVMLSTNGGASWNAKFESYDNPVINTVSHDLAPCEAYAAGEEDGIWFSGDCGINWPHQGGSFGNTINCRDIYPDPAVNNGGYVYAGGTGNIKAAMSTDMGESWSTIQSGFESVSSINQIAKGGAIPWLYAATSSGLYKYPLGTTPVTWSPRSNGIGTPNLGSIVVDNSDPLCFLTSTAPGVTPPHIWASGDSGRSWVDLPLGDIPNDVSINRLASSEDGNPGFVAGTSVGVFHLSDIFIISGTLAASQTWGPGTVIVNGDVTVPAGVTLTIAAGTQVLFVPAFDNQGGGANANKAEIIVYGTLTAQGGQGAEIVFDSYSQTAYTGGNWYGIRALSGSDINMSYCQVKQAYAGLTAEAADIFEIQYSRIEDCADAGIIVEGVDATGGIQANITNCAIQDCGTYGVYARESCPALQSRMPYQIPGVGVTNVASQS